MKGDEKVDQALAVDINEDKMESQTVHKSVLLDEALEWWTAAATAVQRPVFIDCTFGRGGHSRALLRQLPGAHLIVFDKDPSAIEAAQLLAAEPGHQERVTVIHESFAVLKDIVAERGLVGHISGVLMDLGVSSPQLDEAERGFSFMREGPLDMRMDCSSGQTAAEWLQHVDEQTLANVLFLLGEEKQSRKIARKIVMARQESPIENTAQLAELVCQVSPRRVAGKHPATRTFQAIRIFINRELDDLKQGLEAAFDVLAPTGHLVVLSFHSLEDRIVKQFMQRMSKPKELPRRLPVPASALVMPGKCCVKGQRPCAEEVATNPRARSAILRVLEKVE